MPTPKGYQKLNLNVPEDLFREFKATTAALTGFSPTGIRVNSGADL